MIWYINSTIQRFNDNVEHVSHYGKLYIKRKLNKIHLLLKSNVATLIQRYWVVTDPYTLALKNKKEQIKFYVKKLKIKFFKLKFIVILLRFRFNIIQEFKLNPYLIYFRNIYYFSKYTFVTLTKPKIWATNFRYYDKRSKLFFLVRQCLMKIKNSFLGFVYFLDNYLLAYVGRRVQSSFGGLISSRRFMIAFAFAIYLVMVASYIFYLLYFICYYEQRIESVIAPLENIVESSHQRGLQILDSKETLQEVVKSRIRVLQHLSYPRNRDCWPLNPTVMTNYADIEGYIFGDLFPEEIEENNYRLKQIGCVNLYPDPNYEPKSPILKKIKKLVANDFSKFYLNENSHLNHFVYVDKEI